MQVDILTPEEKVFSGDAQMVTLPGLEGSFQIMNNHAPIISALAEGKLIVATGADTQTFEIKSGIVEMLNNQVSILVEGIS